MIYLLLFYLILVYGFTDFLGPSYDTYDYIKLFRNKLFSYVLALIHRLKTWTFVH